jgi:hypothetical protein
MIGIISILNTVFDDKRIMVAVVWVWMVVVLAVFTEMGLLRSDFVRFGPSPTTLYVGIVLDTWGKWGAVAGFTAVSSFMNDLAGESLEPFFLMVLRDHKTRYIPYSKSTSVLLNQGWSLYCSIMSVFGLYTYFAQADLLVIKMVVGLIVNLYSSWRYLRNKVHEPVKYMRYFQQTDEEEGNDAPWDEKVPSMCDETDALASSAEKSVQAIAPDPRPKANTGGGHGKSQAPTHSALRSVALQEV